MKWGFDTFKKINARALQTKKLEERFKLQSLNKFCFYTVFLALIWCVVFIFLQWYQALLLTVFSGFSFGTVLYFNFKKKFTLAKVVLIIGSNLSVIGITAILGYDAGFYLYLFTAPFFVFWLFDIEKEKRYIATSITTYIISYIITLFFKHTTAIIILKTDHVDITLHDLNIVSTIIFLFLLFNNYATYFSILRDELVLEKENLKEEVILRKKDQIHLKKLYKEVKISNVNLEQFGFIVSHNIRAPFANIKGFLDLYDPLSNDEEEKTEIVDCINKSVINLDGVLNDLIFLLTLRKDLKEEKEQLLLTDLIDSIKQSLAFDLKQLKINIHEEYLPSFKINTVRTIIHSVLFNLVQNAIKYRNQSIQTKITISATETQKEYTIIVSDNGIGIDLEKHQNKIFGLYHKFHTQVEGKGVGLYMVKTQVNLLGGSIKVESTPNVGTYFIITFPK